MTKIAGIALGALGLILALFAVAGAQVADDLCTPEPRQQPAHKRVPELICHLSR